MSGALLAWMVCQINQITAVLTFFLVIGITEADVMLTKNLHGLSIFGVGLASHPKSINQADERLPSLGSCLEWKPVPLFQWVSWDLSHMVLLQPLG